MSDRKPILIGAIIHLGNMLKQDSESADGGYLDVREWVTEKPEIKMYHDPSVHAFVSTYRSKNRAMGSGSWQLLSADGMKQPGDQLAIGDKVHLLNMYSGAGYLDSFEWVRNMTTFTTYPMQIGVFTSASNRGRGASGTWTIRAANKEQPKAPIFEDQVICLENDYPGAGFLRTYGEVTEHELFKKQANENNDAYKYDGQRLFVFTGPQSDSASTVLTKPGSAQWKFTVSDLATHLYRVYSRRGEQSAPWHYGGIFKLGVNPAQPFRALNITSSDMGVTLNATVTYTDAPIEYALNHQGENRYAIASESEDSYWQIGARESQRVIALDVTSTDGGNTLAGTITYQGEAPIGFNGVRSTKESSSRLLYDYFHPSLLKGRTNKIAGVIDATYRLLCDSFQTMSAVSMDATLQEIEAAEIQGEAALNTVLDKTKPAQNQDSLNALDHRFQIEQLLNLYHLSSSLNNFFWHELQDNMKQSLENHQNDHTLPPLHLLRKCSQSVAADHEIIQQAATQRRWHQSPSQSNVMMGDQAGELLLMDKLAIRAIAPFQHLLPGHANHPAIITYLSERTHIHSLPYTDRFILVGVSYDHVPPAAGFLDDVASSAKEFYAYELMAIPHEVGHYVYQHGTLPNGKTFIEVGRQFAGNNPYYHWSEEIFADLYGCIVAGPLSVLGMQALLMSIDRDRAWKDDEEHPTPAIRLFILTEILRILPKIKAKLNNAHWAAHQECDFAAVTQKLDERWAIVIERWGYKRVEEKDENKGRPTRIYLPDESALSLDRLVNVARIIDGVRPLIIDFATHLLDAAQPVQISADEADTLPTQIPWSQANHVDLNRYDAEMLNLTDREFAGKKAPYQTFVQLKDDPIKPDRSDPDIMLQKYLDNWGDSGPSGSGAGAR